MRNLSKIFENKNIDYEKLLEYGFIKNNNDYIFATLIYNHFKVYVEISKEKQVSRVIDLNLNDEYVLVDIKDATGDYVGKIKEEYEKILNNIIEKCTTMSIFKSKQAGQIIKCVKEKYDDNLEYLWQKFPNNAVWRNKKNNKWYGAILTISESKLGIDSDKTIEIIDLRYQKDKIKDIINDTTIFGGYHMNKDNWITIKLDGSIDIKEIYQLIDNSYELSLKK